MSRRTIVASALAALALGTIPVRADDLTGAYNLLCSTGNITICYEDGDCEAGDAEALNVPRFIEVDLNQKKLSTTRASGLNRSTSADTVKRVDGTIVVQGYENGRAYSFVIQEKTGHMAVAVASASRGVTSFGACTPLPSK